MVENSPRRLVEDGQDVPQWIVAHGRLSARTAIRQTWMVTPEFPNRIKWTHFNAVVSYECATSMRCKLLQVILHNTIEKIFAIAWVPA